jgi:O-antigen/teichoic acid export membrane protein/protein-tyrosine-phosphatase
MEQKSRRKGSGGSPFARLLSDSWLYVLGNVLRRGVSVVTMPVLTRYLSPAGYGFLSVVGTVLSMLEAVFEMGITGAATRFYYECPDQRARRRLFGTLLLVSLLGTIPLTVLLLLFGAPVWNRLVPDIPFSPYVSLTIVSVLLGMMGILPRVLFRVEDRVRTFFRLSIVQTLATATIAVVLVVAFDFGPLGPILATLAMSAVFAVVYAVYLWPHVDFVLDGALARRSLKFGLPNIPVHVGTWAVKAGDRLILQHFTSLAVVGIYSVGCAVGKIAFDLVGNAIHWAIVPFFYATVKREPEHRAKVILARMATYNVAVLAVLGMLTVLWAQELIAVLASSRYMDAVTIVPVIAAASLLQVLANVPAKGIALKEKTLYFPAVTGISAVISLGLDLLLIPTLGLMGAAWGMLAGQIAYLGLSLRLSQRLYPIPYEWSRIARLLGLSCLWAGLGFAVSEWTLIDRLAAKTALSALFPLALLAVGVLTRDEARMAHERLAAAAASVRSVPRGWLALPAAVAAQGFTVLAELLLVTQFLASNTGPYGIGRRQKARHLLETLARVPRTGVGACRRELRRTARESLGFTRPGLRVRPDREAPELPSGVRRVVFVCRGNILRSPMAAALLRRHDRALSVESAGLHAEPGRPADPRARQLAPEFGVTLDEHATRRLTDDMISAADLIVVMDRLNETELLARWPDAMDRVLLLGAAAGTSPVEIPDPFVGDVATVRRCYRLLHVAVGALAQRLDGAAGHAAAPENRQAVVS